MESFYYGLDLGWDITQLSRFNKKTGQPESVCLSGREQELLMPAAICRRTADGEWFAGQEAVRLAARGAGELVSGLLGRLMIKDSIVLGGKEYTPDLLMEQYFRKLSGFLRQCYGTAEVTKLAVTLPKEAEGLKETLTEVFSRVGIGKEKLCFVSHTECFMYYCINMPQELWVNDVALFDCDEQHFYYERLSCSKKRQPIVVLAREEDFSEKYKKLTAKDETQERKGYWFYNLAVQLLQGQPVTTLYITGAGFAGGWADEAMKKLCEGRRVFFGQNLYTKGACYAAKMTTDGSNADYMLLCGNMTQESIYVKLYQDSKERYVELSCAGTDYRKAGGCLRVVLDGTQEIEFLVSNALKREPVHEVMILENLIRRENKTVMLELSLSYADRETPVVQIRDLGFGSYAKTGRIWEQIL